MSETRKALNPWSAEHKKAQDEAIESMRIEIEQSFKNQQESLQHEVDLKSSEICILRASQVSSSIVDPSCHNEDLRTIEEMQATHAQEVADLQIELVLKIVELDDVQLELNMLSYRLECGFRLMSKWEALWNSQPKGLPSQENLMHALGLADVQIKAMATKLGNLRINVDDVI